MDELEFVKKEDVTEEKGCPKFLITFERMVSGTDSTPFARTPTLPLNLDFTCKAGRDRMANLYCHANDCTLEEMDEAWEIMIGAWLHEYKYIPEGVDFRGKQIFVVKVELY